jgi:Protein of unknown function (DUF3592)
VPRITRKIVFLCALGSFGLGAVFGLIAAAELVKVNETSKWSQANATITHLNNREDSERGDSHRYQEIDCQFKTAAALIQSKVVSVGWDKQMGQELPIRFDPKDPQHIILASTTGAAGAQTSIYSGIFNFLALALVFYGLQLPKTVT